MLIEIKETHSPGAGKKMAHIKTKDGESFEIGPEKLAGIQVGQTYEVEIQDRVWNDRTIRKITKIAPAASQPSAASSSPACGGGAPGEAEYVGRVLAAFILKGEFQTHQMQAFTARLRKIWRETDPEAQGYREAAE